jgi:hypothetical protein
MLVNNSGAGVASSINSTLGDYAITYVNNTGTITPAPVTVTASTGTKVFDGNTTSNVAVTNITGLVGSDSLTNLTQAYNSSQVLGTNGSTLLVNSGGVGLNSSDGDTLNDYAITYANATGTITPAPVTVMASTETKVFDGTTVSNVAVTNITGLVSGDSLTSLSQYYNNAQVLGPNGSTLIVNSSRVGLSSSDGDTLGDYAITYATTNGTITPKPVTVSGVTLNSNGTLNTSNEDITGGVPDYPVMIEPGPTLGTIILTGPDGVDYVLTDSVIGTSKPPSPPFDVDEWNGARWAAYQMANIYPNDWLTLSQNPESPLMLQVAMTGEAPTEGPTRVPGGGSSMSLSCVQGAIRTPDGVDPMQVNDCARPIKPNRGI